MADTPKNGLVAYATLVAGVAAVITALADYKMADNPNREPTSNQSVAHEHKLDERTEELEDWAALMELRLQRIESSDAQCRDNVVDLRRQVKEHLAFSQGKVYELGITLERHNLKINECLRKTGLTGD